MNELLSWASLSSLSGATAATAVITEELKGLPFIKRIPARLLSIIIAVIIMETALLFTEGFSLSGAVLGIFNGVFVSISANGTYDMLKSSSAG